jgi:hypothetical protein
MRPWKALLAVLGIALATAAAPALAVECTTIPDNAIGPCGFESAGEVSAWSSGAGTPSFAAGLGENGGALRGASQDFSGTHIFSANSPCFVVSPGQVVPIGYAVTLASGTSPSCTAGWQQWSDAACTVGAGGAIGFNPTFPGAGYSAVTDSRTVGTGAVAMELIIDCRANGAFEVLIDNAYAAAPQPAPVIKTVPVPTLADLALAMLALALGAVAVARLSRRNA